MRDEKQTILKKVQTSISAFCVWDIYLLDVFYRVVQYSSILLYLSNLCISVHICIRYPRLLIRPRHRHIISYRINNCISHQNLCLNIPLSKSHWRDRETHLSRLPRNRQARRRARSQHIDLRTSSRHGSSVERPTASVRQVTVRASKHTRGGDARATAQRARDDGAFPFAGSEGETCSIRSRGGSERRACASRVPRPRADDATCCFAARGHLQCAPAVERGAGSGCPRRCGSCGCRRCCGGWRTSFG